MNTNACSLVTKARASLCYYEPYFGAALWAIHFVEVPDLLKKAGAPMACDFHWRVYYDPVVVETIADIKKIAGALWHELGHLCRAHKERADMLGVSSINYAPWNIAADCELNDDAENDPNIDFKGYGAAMVATFGGKAPGYVLPVQIEQQNGKTRGRGSNPQWGLRLWGTRST